MKDKIPYLFILLLLPFIGLGQTSNIVTCEGKNVTYDDLVVTTDAPGVVIDATGCDASGGSVLEYLNCIAVNNPIPDDFNYNLEIKKEDILNGVSTADLIHSQRHILHIAPLELACEKVAADVNGDNKINVIDLVEMRRLILGIDMGFRSEPSWKFYKSVDIEQSGIGADTDLVFSYEDFPLAELSIVAIKTGDINKDALPN